MVRGFEASDFDHRRTAWVDLDIGPEISQGGRCSDLLDLWTRSQSDSRLFQCLRMDNTFGSCSSRAIRPGLERMSKGTCLADRQRGRRFSMNVER
jgi:hypothetical protein